MTAETKVKPIEHAILRITTDKKPETVNQPIEFLKQTTTASKNEILNTIIKLQNQRKLELATPQHEPTSLSAFLKTSHATQFWITIALTYATLIAVFTIPADMQPITYVRNILGAIFVFQTLGYAFVKALAREC